MICNCENLTFNVLSVDRFLHSSGTFNVKSRIYGALSLRIRGEGRFEIQGKSFISKPGDVIFIPKDVSYRVEYTEGESIAIHFSECNYNLVENISLAKWGGALALFENLLKLYNDGQSANRTKALIFEILDEIDTQYKASMKDEEFIRLVEYTARNFSDMEFNIDSLCSVFFVSKSTLQRKFNKYYNMSPKQYILMLRVQKALKLLASGEFSVKEIAYACGFRDEKYFSRVIKERYGRSPSEFINGIKI